MPTNPEIQKFWEWFTANAEALSGSDIERAKLGELDALVGELSPDLSWEIGPGEHESYQFVISPNLNRELLERSREIIAAAPVLDGWEFFPTRRPKKWTLSFTIESTSEEPPVEVSAADWQFALIQHDNEMRELILFSEDMPPLTEEQRWLAAAVVLESILGEEVLLATVDEFSLETQLDDRFDGLLKPIQELRTELV